MWKAHNKEWNLEKDSEKETYLSHMNSELKKDEQTNALNAYTVMSNHSHELYFLEDIIEFSNMMRNHHSRYGMYYNRKHKRCGKVAYERPKTCLIEDDDYSMRATFYIHANPVKAGITKNAANYKWSTHKFYAFGKKDEMMKYVVLPEWYMRLGRTMKDRQRAYRKLFDEYLRELGLIKQSFLEKHFYGDPFWVLDFTKKVSDWNKKDRSKDPPGK
jgi:putative transposase